MKTTIILGLLLVLSFGSCKKYLDVKPDKQMVLPETIEDCEALMDSYLTMNTSYPVAETSADNYYLTFDTWRAQPKLQQDTYVWDANAQGGLVLLSGWSGTYKRVLFANQVLETLGKITPDASQTASYNRVKAEALFFRAFSLFKAAEVWAKPYDAATASTDLGIPVPLVPDITEKTDRGTLQRTYDRILQDLNAATGLFPAAQPTSVLNKTRPGLAAAHGLLARVYLSMRDYVNAGLHAGKCLQNYGVLMNFNTLNQAASFPIAKYNPEVILEAIGISTALLGPFTAKVDPALYASYEANDRRKVIFFQENTGAVAGTYLFKGNYEGSSTFSVFCGIPTDEIYLIRAECYARAGNTDLAMADLNTLLRNRYSGTYIDKTASGPDDALVKILTERRKELLYRDNRWSDLRRLNKDPKFAITLSRNLNGTVYTLPPNDLRYTLLIPDEVLRRENLPQNPR